MGAVHEQNTEKTSVLQRIPNRALASKGAPAYTVAAIFL